MGWAESSAILDKLFVFIIGLSLSLASIFLLIYYWVVSMTYISPSQNFTTYISHMLEINLVF